MPTMSWNIKPECQLSRFVSEIEPWLAIHPPDWPRELRVLWLFQTPRERQTPSLFAQHTHTDAKHRSNAGIIRYCQRH